MVLLASLAPFPSSSPLTSISPTPPIPLYSLSSSFSSSASSNRRSHVLISRRTAITLLTSSLAAPSLLLLTPVFSVARAETKYDSQLDEDLVVRIFQGASPSVVFIKEYELQNQGKEEDDGKVADTGSGFVWDRYGHIVTNYHVIAKLATDRSGLQRCKVFLEDSNGDTFSREGNLIGFDPAYDLAVLKVDVEGDKLKPALIGTSRNLRVGQSCFAIGNPYGYEHTLTTGVVSGLGREIPSPNGRPIRGAIQTDAAINAGNSGGPLIDSYGHVIGINTATFTRKGTGISSGVNFAIPIDVVVRTVPYLIVYGTSVNNRF